MTEDPEIKAPLDIKQRNLMYISSISNGKIPKKKIPMVTPTQNPEHLIHTRSFPNTGNLIKK